MTMIAPPIPRVKFDSRRTEAPGRPFGLGILRSLPSTVEPYSSADLAFERARSLSLDAGFALPAPDDLDTPAEVSAWDCGAAEAERIVADRLDAMEAEAEWLDHCELAEARVATSGEYRD